MWLYIIYYSYYVPGPYRIQVQYADVNIQGSPFIAHAYDTSQVRVGSIPDGIVKQPVHFDGEFADTVCKRSFYHIGA